MSAPSRRVNLGCRVPHVSRFLRDVGILILLTETNRSYPISSSRWRAPVPVLRSGKRENCSKPTDRVRNQTSRYWIALDIAQFLDPLAVHPDIKIIEPVLPAAGAPIVVLFATGGGEQPLLFLTTPTPGGCRSTSSMSMPSR